MVNILNDLELRRKLKSGEIKIQPFEETRIGPMSYDLTTITDSIISETKIRLKTLEEIGLARNICGLVFFRSRAAKRSILCTFGPLIDPGFSGHLIFYVDLGFGVIEEKDLRSLFQVIFIEINPVGTAYNERKTSTAMERSGF